MDSDGFLEQEIAALETLVEALLLIRTLRIRQSVYKPYQLVTSTLDADLESASSC